MVLTFGFCSDCGKHRQFANNVCTMAWDHLAPCSVCKRRATNGGRPCSACAEGAA